MSRSNPVPIRKVREDALAASTFTEKGWHLIAQGDYAAAEQVLETALVFAPSDPRARSLMGWAVMRQGRYDEARELLETVLQSDTTSGIVLANLGYVYLKTGLLEKAETSLKSALQMPRDPKAILYGNFYLGLLYSLRNDLTRSRNCFEKSIAAGPSFIEAYYELGRACWESGDEAEADRMWKSGNSANRFSLWGRRCAEAMRATRAGDEPRGFS